LDLLRTNDMTKLIAKQADSNLTEADAIRQAKDGDSVAFEYLYKANCRRVYSVCLRKIKNPAEAKDLTQQAFLQPFRKIGTFRGESGFSTWLHRVTVNVVLMHLRRKRPTEIMFKDLDRPGSDHEGPREHGSSDTSMLGAVERLNLKRAIRKLPSGYKRHFLLYDVLGYAHKEIARHLGCSTGSSKSQLTKRANVCVGCYRKNEARRGRPMPRPRRSDVPNVGRIRNLRFQIHFGPG
jgi:RNA polymerase sigma-70 factor (ECF subfamily)